MSIGREDAEESERMWSLLNSTFVRSQQMSLPNRRDALVARFEAVSKQLVDAMFCWIKKRVSSARRMQAAACHKRDSVGRLTYADTCTALAGGVETELRRISAEKDYVRLHSS